MTQDCGKGLWGHETIGLMSLGLAGLYQKNIPESSRVQLYTQGEAGSGVSLRDKPLLLARVSNDIILSGMSDAL